MAATFGTFPDGYGMFVHHGKVRCQAAVATTADGGVRFSALVQVTSWQCDDNPPAGSLAFGGQNGFLYGPGLFVTHDGGRTWARDRQPGPVLAVATAGQSAWLVEAACPGTAWQAGRRCGLRLLLSADGGRSWTPSPAQVPGARTGPAGRGQTWLVRTGRSAGYLLAAPSINPGGHPDTTALWYTADSGRSWAKRMLQCGFDAVSVAVAAAPDGTLLAVCASQPSAGWQPKSVARSVDGGRTWTLRIPCPATAPACPGASPLDSGYLGGIDAVSGSVAYLSGARTPVLVTHDGGGHWQAVQPLMGDDSGWSGPVTFSGPSDGVVIADGADTTGGPAIFRTTDGGTHWSQVVPTIG